MVEVSKQEIRTWVQLRIFELPVFFNGCFWSENDCVDAHRWPIGEPKVREIDVGVYRLRLLKLALCT